MYQWRKFEFFEEKLGGGKCKFPEEITGKIECASSGRGKLVIGFDEGSVSLLDRGLNFNFGFQAHTSSVLFLQMLKQRNFLASIGEDEQISTQQSGMSLKVFDLDKSSRKDRVPLVLIVLEFCVFSPINFPKLRSHHF